MKQTIVLILATILVISGCSLKKQDNIVFNAVVEEVYEGSILVTTKDDVGFYEASVTFDQDLEIDFDLEVDQNIEIEILPQIQEKYPVGVTAVRIELLEEKSDTMYQTIRAQEAKNMMETGDVIILDVRTQSEYDEGHIKDAMLIPNTDLESLAPQKIPDKDQTILVYCRSGNRSETSAKLLINMGYTNVYDFGGIIDWPYEIVTEN